jgi:large subunit ribosomal protein L15
MNELSRLKPAAGATKKRKRKGRGIGSGNGKTCGKGQKGQNSRSGGGVMPGFEGGQMPLHRRLPKVGFTNIFRVEYSVINVAQLNQFEDGQVLDAEALMTAGLVRTTKKPVKILGHGELTKKVTLKVNKASASATSKVEALGGTIEVIGG